jgi:hypothetical protein
VNDDQGKYCIACGATAPTLGDDTTLLSQRGWRVTKEVNPQGGIFLNWRCPPCWKRHREKKEMTKPTD